MSTPSTEPMADAFERWMAVKAEHLPDGAGVPPTPETAGSREQARKGAAHIAAILAPVGVPAGPAIEVASVMALACARDYARAMPGRTEIPLESVFVTGFLDGIGLGSVYRAQSDQELRVELRERTIAAEDRAEELVDGRATVVRELVACRTQLERVREELARTQLAAGRRRGRIVDAFDRLRSTGGTV